MSKYNLFKNRLFIYICCLYLVGMIFGFFLSSPNKYQITFGDASFLRVFCVNYWYLFLMWLFGFSFIGLFFNSIIIFIRGFLLGLIIVFLFKNNIRYLAFMLSIEIILFIPAFFTLSYLSLTMSLNHLYCLFQSISIKSNNKTYLNSMIIITIVLIIYCIAIVVYK